MCISIFKLILVIILVAIISSLITVYFVTNVMSGAGEDVTEDEDKK